MKLKEIEHKILVKARMVDYMNYQKLLDYSKYVYPEVISNKERLALIDYTEELFIRINNNLRHGINDGCCAISMIDSALKKFDYDEEIVVYRNVGFTDKYDRKEYIMKLEKGIFHELGYTSTSLFEPCHIFGNDISFTINVPAFFKGACIREISANREENEYLIPRDTDFEILDIIENKNKKFNEPKVIVKAKVVS